MQLDSDFLWFLTGMICLPAILRLGVRLGRRVFPDSSWAVGVIVAISLWLTLTHVLSLLSGQFKLPLLIASILLALGGASLPGRLNQRPCSESVWSDRKVRCAGLLVLIVFAPIVLLYDFHDRFSTICGHYSTAEQMLNDVYPPRQISRPERVFAYHIGIDTLAASLAVFLPISVPLAFDLLTVILLIAYLGLLAELGRKWLGREFAWLIVLVGTFSGGLGWLLGGLGLIDAPDAVAHLLGIQVIGEMAVNPGLVSYFFQSGWLFGLAVTLLFIQRSMFPPPIGTAGYAMLATDAMLLTALGLSSTALFLGLAASLLFSSLLRLCWGQGAGRELSLTLGGSTILALGATACLSPMSKLLRQLEEGESDGFSLFAGALTGGGVAADVLWFAASLGVVLPLGMYGLTRLRADRLLWYPLVLGNLSLPYIVHYSLTWDMVKFTTAALFFLSLLSGLALSRLLHRAPYLSVAVLLLIVAPGVIFSQALLRTFAQPRFEIAFWRAEESKLHPDQVSAREWLRRNMLKGESLVAERRLGTRLALTGGVPQLALDENFRRAVGMSAHEFKLRETLLEKPGDSAVPYRTLSACWILAEESGSSPQADLVQRLTARGEADIVQRFGAVTITRIRECMSQGEEVSRGGPGPIS